MSRADLAARKTHRNASSPVTKHAEQLVLDPAAVHAQAAAGAPLNLTTGFSLPSDSKTGNVGYSIKITKAMGGTEEPVYTVTGTYNGQPQTTTVTIVGLALSDVSGYTSVPFQTVTSITSDIDPGTATDFDSADAYLIQPSRAVDVGGTGHLSCRLDEDGADSLWSALPAGTILPIEIKIARCTDSGRSGITASTASLVTVAR